MTTPPAGTAASDTFTHLLLPFDGMEQFLGGAVPFLSAGVDAGDRVLAVCGPAREALLRDALGPAAGGVEFTEAAAWYEHPSRTLSDCLSDACDTARQGRRLRLLGEPVWATRPPLEVVEWQRAEAVLNIAFRGTGAAIMCPYAASLPASVVAAGRKTHPETVRGARAVANPGFLNPWTFCGQCDDEPLPPPPAGADTLDIDRPDLYWLRAYVADCARQTPLPEEDRQRLLVAVTEIVTNALRHGAPPVVLRLWTDESDGTAALVCEVTDKGRWAPGTGYGLVPPAPGSTASGGRFGLWAVRLLCSVVQIRTGEDGTAVRLRLTLPHPPDHVRMDGA
ncbi:sensor histidine kinase [Actinomadura madurae]|uniref:sensor histidine kinase n=1 Tax=Actinomadura madurae TaxID=1993 RepID=UPI002025DD97|nr:sensor histidine kinase [Actinomadura madurae]MCQ0005533.1 sensor histidine kinase [Actinomadura madurae]URM99169.1 sensor histidine kinase [Actinomadura madurae]